MGLSPEALFQAVSSDVQEYTPFGPVGLGDIPPDASYKQFACTHLIANLTKKFVRRNNLSADEAAKKKFFASNKKCKDWMLPDMMESDRILLGEFRKELDDFLHPEGLPLLSSMFDILEHARVGPGSSVGARGFSLYAKLFASRMTTTSDELNLVFRRYIARFPTFDEAFAKGRQELGEPLVVDSSRCSFAPKTTDCSRMICVEPSLNMYFQLGLGALIEERLKTYFRVDLSTQPSVNRRLAQHGSLTGRFSTIDLSSASDCISLSMCKQFLPGWFFSILELLRSRSTVIDGRVVQLEMMSTMGNGFTFPLETLIFSCLIRAAYRVTDKQLHDIYPNWACFGDDLICESECFRNVSRLLGMLGFDLNDSKTFFEGPFRESCGADWHNGQPVRPVFVKKLDSLQDILVTINLLNEWSSYTGVPLIKGISYLLSGIRVDIERLFVPYRENNDAGLRVPSLLLSELHKHDSNGSRLYRPFRSVPKKIRIRDGVIVTPRGFKELIFNPQGLEISFLYGELKDYAIFVRHDNVRYSQKLQCVPFWDYTPSPDSYDGREFVWQRWETAVLINMSNPPRKGCRA